MAIMTESKKSSEPKVSEMLSKKHTKYHRARPITATLEHPLILDIKLLKKLDMTTFTKKGLIALSKFCGISLINKTDTKKKLNKCVKTIQLSKKHSGNERSVTLIPESNISYKTKRKLEKKIAKATPRFRFIKAKEEVSPDEDSLDVVYRNHNKVLKTRNQRSTVNDKSTEKKLALNNILKDTIENIIPEPCKTCNRSEHPERFHSHPKMLMSLALQEKSNEKNLNERFRAAVTTRDKEEDEKEDTKENPCATEIEGKLLQDSLLPCEEQTENKCFVKINSSKSSSKSLKNTSAPALSFSEAGHKITSSNFRKPLTPSPTLTKTKNEILRKPNLSAKEGNKSISAEEDIKLVTGCYICGKQVSPKLRIKHEKSCILKWRTHNSLTSSEKRKPEPKRPDYRFTASGDLDCEGTFESIWANHIDSLVPCKKCGRKFFPDRIERHENCCNNLPISMKYKH